MTMMKGGPAGPDPAQGDGRFRQDVDFDRAALWDSLGGRQGILRGLTHTLVAAQLSVDLAAGAAVVEERTAVGALGLGRGYHVWADVATRVTFDVPSAAARSDALVVGFADTEDGALGASVTQVGGQAFIVKGVSGTSTPRTDAQINAALGRGGWLRYADVVINPGDTQVNPAGVTVAPNSVSLKEAGAWRWIANTFNYGDQLAYAVVGHATERTALTTSMTKLAGTALVVDLQGSCSITSGLSQSLYLGMRINGADFDVARTRIGEAFARDAFTAHRRITGIAAGPLTIEPVFKTAAGALVAFTTGEDSISYTVREAPA